MLDGNTLEHSTPSRVPVPSVVINANPLKVRGNSHIAVPTISGRSVIYDEFPAQTAGAPAVWNNTLNAVGAGVLVGAPNYHAEGLELWLMTRKVGLPADVRLALIGGRDIQADATSPAGWRPMLLMKGIDPSDYAWQPPVGFWATLPMYLYDPVLDPFVWNPLLEITTPPSNLRYFYIVVDTATTIDALNHWEIRVAICKRTRD